MKNLFFICLLLIAFSGNLYAQKAQKHKHETDSADSSSKKSTIKYGIASFYSKKFNGRQTANGEIFSSSKYTAACNRLPLNTWIKVTNLRNDKSVIVKVNDRLHPKNKRLVDLSRVAAKELGFTGRGLTRVKVEVLKNYHPS